MPPLSMRINLPPVGGHERQVDRIEGFVPGQRREGGRSRAPGEGILVTSEDCRRFRDRPMTGRGRRTLLLAWGLLGGQGHLGRLI